MVIRRVAKIAEFTCHSISLQHEDEISDLADDFPASQVGLGSSASPVLNDVPPPLY